MTATTDGSRLLVLWDVDRTLLFAGGVDKRVWLEVAGKLTGRLATELGTTSGRTDPEILCDALVLAGATRDEARQRLSEALQLEAALLAARREELRTSGHALSGAREVLDALAAHPQVVQSVLTGNIRPNAELKLATFGLDRHLDLAIGAYGSDDARRPRLVRLAQQRAQQRHDVMFDASNTVLVGDSPRDIEAGRHGGARVVAVATGRTDAEALRAAGAATVLPDLADTAAAVKAILHAEPGPRGRRR